MARTSRKKKKKNALAKNMVLLRTAKNWTQEEAAEMARLSPRYYQSIEYGEKTPSVKSLAAIREALDCSWNALMEGVKSR